MKSPISLLRGSIDIFLSNPKLFVGIYLIPGILSFLLAFLISYGQGLGLSMLANFSIVILLSIAMIVISILMAVAVMLAVIDPTLTIWQAYERAKSFFLQYLLLSVLISLVTFIGFFLLIVPGIIFLVWFAFAYYILLIEEKSGIDAMKRSKELVTGKWWAVFWRLVALLAVVMVVSIIFASIVNVGSSPLVYTIMNILNILVSAVLVPVSIAYMYLLYKDLKWEEPIAEIFDIPAVGNSQQA